MSLVQTFCPQEGLPRHLGESVCALAYAIWPPKSELIAPNFDQTLQQWQWQQSAHFLIYDTLKNDSTTGSDTVVLAHALIFPRTVFTLTGPLTVGALATVCVHPDYRGRGWGVDVVRAAFDYLPQIGAEVSLFQTGVPSFYEKLGARLVTNHFVNGSDPNNPFWDTCEMIYPQSFDWPDGAIDLNGPGY